MRILLTTLLLCSSLAVLGQKTGAPNNHPDFNSSKVVMDKPGVILGKEASEEELKAFILNYKSVLAQTQSGLKLNSDKSTPGGRHVNFLQTFQDVPVYETSVLINLNNDGKVSSLISNLKSFDPVVEGGFAHSLQEAEALVWESYSGGNPEFKLESDPMFWIVNNQLLPVIRVNTDGGTEAFEIILNANDLTEVQVRDRAVYHRHAGGVTADSSGSGMVFNPDPLTTAGVYYGGNYVDNNDANSTFLNLERQAVVLEDINFTGGTFYLTGPWVTIDDSDESPNLPNPTSTDGNFEYLRADDGFEAVMCYYHVDTYQRYIQSLGFNALGNFSISCDPHGLNGSDNSHFVPSGAEGRIAFGEGGVDDAEDADVIVHEYGHALSNHAIPGGNGGGSERNGLDEGIGDYIAASYSRSLNAFRWEDTFTWDGHNTFWGGRDAKTTMLYPPSSWNFYDYGEIWATALMRAWDSLGQTISDRVFFEELHYNLSGTDLNTAAHFILEADTALYGGIHTNTYQAIFCDMNIFTGTECIVSVDETKQDEFKWLLFPNPANDQVTLYLPDLHRMQQVEIEIFDMAGRKVMGKQVNELETTLSVEVLNSGMYIFNLIEKDQILATKKLAIQ